MGQGKLSTPKQKFKKQRKIKLQHVTWESPRKNCAKKAHHKSKKKHHIAVPSRAWRSIFSRDQRCLNCSRYLHNIFTWESPRKNCAKKAHHKIKKKHHIAVPSRAWKSIFSGDHRCLSRSRDAHNISLSFWWSLWKINPFSLEAIWNSHVSHYWNSFCSLLSEIFFC